MNCSEEKAAHHGGHGRGPSSFRMQDADLVFDELNIRAGDCFVDLGCGPGDYSLRAADFVGDSGLVRALDRDGQAIARLEKILAEKGLTRIKPLLADLAGPLPLDDASADICFMATVLHGLNRAGTGQKLWPEVRRILKPGGRLAIIECKKEDQPWGPPVHIRLSPEQVEELITPHGFRPIRTIDLGKNYMIQFAL